MSDQSPPPPKPKPGSLRDRIAAFEKSSSAAPPPAPAPAVRPKPAGFASWKPKVPSPPSSPPATSTEQPSPSARAGGMSASDAKESITKAGSLKDRMAALQGKGAFGAPPPLAPKPAVEKPKWKPPPVVQAPVDDDAHHHTGEASTEAVAAAVERTISPPVSVKSRGVDMPKVLEEGGEPAASAADTGGDNEGEPAAIDPEEEERQRRAAIAARMARLGGARLGMAPPVFGKKPPSRKSTQEDVPKTEEPPNRDVSTTEAAKSSEDQFSPPAETSTTASPPTATPVQAQAVSDARQSQEYFPVRKSSENASILSSESADSLASRSPSSMPIPVVPRRAGPPRKKPVKPVVPPPEVVEEKAEETGPASLALEDAERISHKPTPEAEHAAPAPDVIANPEHEEVKPEVTEEIVQPPVSEPSSYVHKEPTPEPIAEKETIAADKEETEATSISSQAQSRSSLSEENSGTLSVPPSHVTELDDIEDDDSEYEDAEAIDISESPPVLPSPPQASHDDVDQPKDEEHIRPEISTPVVDALEEETDAAEEEARKKRVADRMAKMGGINPFAPPPPPQIKPAPQPAHSPPPASAAFISSPPVAPGVNEPDLQLEALSSSLEDAQIAHEESVVESTAEEEASDVEDDDILDNKPAPAAKNEHERPVTPTLPHSESHRESVDFASRPPPLPPVGTRPPVQFQQYEQEDDEGSDYGDDDSEPDIPVTPSRPSNAPGHPPVSPPPFEHENEAPSPPARPVQPPRRIIPQAPESIEYEEDEREEEEETDEEADERLATSQLFVRPPTGRGPIAIPQHVQAEVEEDGDGSENDSPALPILHRRSLELPPGRLIPPPPPIHHPALDEDSEPESDHDGQALPVPLRRASVPPPRIVPPPPPPPQAVTHQPPPVHRTLPPAPPQLDVDHFPMSPDQFTPTVSISGSEEILDEEEGDPIDPSFHSPSQRTSFANLHAIVQAQAEAEVPALVQCPPLPPPVQSRPPPPPPTATFLTSEQAEQPEEDPEQARRKTIAERMAKLGGIRFGAAPLPTPASRPPPPRQEDEEDETQNASAPEEQPAALSEEDEERARKQRISAKLANMGGMRIGMMPMGMGGLPPQRSHVLREENIPSSPVPPSRAVPPARPPPPPAAAPLPQQGQDTDSEYAASEDGVKVEVDESDMEEVGYEDAAEEPEEAPPVPSRGGRAPHRQASMDKPTSPPPHIPSPRPPVPTAMPTRRSSIQTSRSTASTTGGETGMSPPQRKRSSYAPPSQSEYVMVEEPEGQEMPPPPPARPVSRVPPMRSAPQAPRTTSMTSQTSEAQDSISSQWELPSIPTSSLNFGGGADLSLSWTDAGESSSPTTSAPPPPPAKNRSLPSSAERHLSADELIALWGRVGVQVCEVATTLFEKSKKTLIGDGTYAGFVQSVLSAVPNAASIQPESGGYGYLIYVQNGPSVQKRVSEIMPGDIVEIHDAKLKGHKGIQTYHQNVGGTGGEVLVGVVGEFEAKKSKIRVFHANQHVGQQTVESVSYRLEDLKSGIVRVYRVLDA